MNWLTVHGVDGFVLYMLAVASDLNVCPVNLPLWLLDMCLDVFSCPPGTTHQDGTVGQRPCHLSFVIQLSQLLRQVQEGLVGDHQELAGALRVSYTAVVIAGMICMQRTRMYCVL